jgi:hypothetical protein
MLTGGLTRVGAEQGEKFALLLEKRLRGARARSAAYLPYLNGRRQAARQSAD